MAKNIKVGFIRDISSNSTVCSLKMVSGLSEKGITPELLYHYPSLKKEFDSGMPSTRLTCFGNFNKIPFISELIQYRYGINGWMFGFKKAAKEYDILSPIELSSVSSYQAVKTGIPTVVKVWENIPYNWVLFPYSEAIRKVGNPKFSKLVAKKAALFLAISERSKESLKIHGISEERINVVPEAVDTKLFKPLSVDNNKFRKKYGLNEKDRVLLFIGRLSWEKGLNDLLFMMKSISRERDDVKLIMIGDGPLKKQVDEAISLLKLKKHVIRIPKIDFTKLPEYYCQADLFVLPSIPLIRIAEQFGKVLAEAMACGTPVVSTFCGAISEVVENGKTGILVPPADRMRLKKAVLSLLENEHLRKEMGKNAREHVLKKFSPEIILSKLADAYKSVV